jgi:hypothetical protein
MSQTKVSLTGINLNIPGQGEFGSNILAGDGKIVNLFTVYHLKKMRNISVRILNGVLED